jgi:hypothetical protein
MPPIDPPDGPTSLVGSRSRNGYSCRRVGHKEPKEKQKQEQKTSHQGKKEEQKKVSKEYGNMVQRSTKNSNNQTKQMLNDRTRAWQ